jgi:hypothetical protein
MISDWPNKTSKDDKDGQYNHNKTNDDVADEAYHDGSKHNSYTIYNPFNEYPSGGDGKRSLVVALVHELLGHGYDFDQGTQWRGLSAA